MNNIITIYDIEFNGKTGKKIYQKYHQKYNSCILNFKENNRLHFNYLRLKNKNLFYQKKKINMKEYNIIIFNYGEDTYLSKEYLNKIIPIYNFLKETYKHLYFFNNPLNHSIICDKLITYRTLQHCTYVKIPKYGVINKKKNIKNIKRYPVIISKRKQSGGLGKYIIKNKKDFDEYDDTFFKNKFWATFYKSYLPNTKIFISIRLFIFNNILVDFVCRPSLNWNCHTGNQVSNKDIILNANHFFDTFKKKNKHYIQNILNELYVILGNGFYAHDFLLVNDKLILCELGYKILDPKLIHIHTKFNLLDKLSHKICNNSEKIHIKYKNLLLNFKLI